MRPGPGDLKHQRLAYTCALLEERFNDVIRIIDEGRKCGVDLVNMPIGPEDSRKHEEPQLIWAIKNGYLMIAKFLLCQPVDLEAKDSEGMTALHIAAGYAAHDIAEEDAILDILGCLLADANRYSRDRFGNTALHIAAMNGRIERVRLILDRNVDLDQVNQKKKTALDVVPECCTEVKDMLKTAMGKK